MKSSLSPTRLKTMQNLQRDVKFDGNSRPFVLDNSKDTSKNSRLTKQYTTVFDDSLSPRKGRSRFGSFKSRKSHVSVKTEKTAKSG
jgi:hypothetical protein